MTNQRNKSRAWGLAWIWTFSCAFIAACASDDSPSPDVDDGPAVEPTLLAVLPDTQYYACGYPQIFHQQTQWIAKHARSRGIAATIHTGDIVDSDVDPQWRVAADSMHALGHVPYTLTAGNHDLSAHRASLLSNYFPVSELERFDEGWGTYEPLRIDNNYAIVQVAGRQWLLLGLEFGPRDAVVDWASQVLTQHAELPAIVFTHAYLYSDAKRYDRRITPRQPYHPDSYAFTPEQGINDGEDLWVKLIEPHHNVKLVLSGHVIPDGTARSSETRADGSVVHQVLANYQHCGTCPCPEFEGGGGYLRLLELHDDLIHVSTYSPHYDRSMDDDENEFDLPL